MSGAIHLYVGVMFTISPEAWMEHLAIAATAPAGLVEMRAFYGGLLSALGALFFCASFIRASLLQGTILMTVTYAAAATVRIYGLCTTGARDEFLMQILWIEVGGTALGAIALSGLAFELRSGPGRLR